MYQARIHENRWWQFGEEMDRVLPEAYTVFADGLQADLSRRWAAA
jgi:hypothetical protein